MQTTTVAREVATLAHAATRGPDDPEALVITGDVSRLADAFEQDLIRLACGEWEAGAAAALAA